MAAMTTDSNGKSRRPLVWVFPDMPRRIWEMSELYMFIESFTGFNYLGRFEEIGSIRGRKKYSVVQL